MNRDLKEMMRDVLEKIGKKEGITDFYSMIADETVATTEEEVLEYLGKVNHPAMTMPAMF
jgi:acetyl-CoA synthase